MNHDERERLLNINELAEWLQVPVATIRKWQTLCPRYGPKPIPIGRHLRWDPAEVRRWLAAQSIGDDGEAGFPRIS